ncbi:countin family protein [Acanthamoeba castellanii str. Neff]|uniref:Countin family protein n=1 Tax=Acanthamoeba castellanii (strain ATCC 30010 / Neff) TaxID=1257118 RepID=L8GFK8_ACACF|nr:countin family protein [Acanthamoeba castellanii str. Neff]ELR10971.1 countin family protein [Acanthamoeba castellanii str. Neff]
MQRSVCFVLLAALALLITFTAASQLSLVPTGATASTAPGEWCPTCIDFLSQVIDQLLEIIANGGVIGSCNQLCSQLDGDEGLVCQLLCDYVGIEALVDLVDEVDPDPIYICEELSVCPISTNSSASFSQFETSPEKGTQGTTFVVALTFVVNSTIGTGELVVSVLPPGAPPALSVDAVELLLNVGPGPYSYKIKVTTDPSEQEPWLPGKYAVTGLVCEGSCGSTHPYAKTLAKAQSAFTITA